MHFAKDEKGFFVWAEKNFKRGRDQIRLYMAEATASNDKLFKNLEDFRRSGLGCTGSTRTVGRIYREWTAPVDAVASRAREEARRLALEESLTRQQERDAEAKLRVRHMGLQKFWEKACADKALRGVGDRR